MTRFGIFGLMLLGAQALFQLSPASADDSSCLGSFESMGSVFKGKTYTATRAFPELSPADALKRGYLFLKNDGMGFAQVDAASGALTAVDANKPSSSPKFNFSAVAAANGGTLVKLSYAFGAGQFAGESDAKKYFCSLLTSVEQTATPDIDVVATIGSPGAPASSTGTQSATAGQGYPTFVVGDGTKQQISSLLDKIADSDRKVGPLMADAKPVLAAVLEIEACSPGQNIALLRRYAIDDSTCSGAVHMAPASRTKNHAKGQCLTVLRINQLEAKAANAFSFKATYLADDSQESSTHEYSFSKKEGEWLMTRCGWIS